MTEIIQITDTTFDKEVMKSDKLVLVDFYADWCGPCKSMAPLLEKFAEEHKEDVKVVKINIDECGALAERFKIRSIPTLITMKDGEGIYGAVGAQPLSKLEHLVSESFRYLAVKQGNKPATPPHDPGIF